MVIDIAERVQRPLAYGIVDEVDNILIDEARTPLIISAPAEESGKEYYRFAKLAPSLHIDEDYTIDAKHRAASLTTEGMGKLEKLLNVQNLYDAENFRLVHFVENALKAQAIFERDRDYVVNEGEVVIVDEFTGPHDARAPLLRWHPPGHRGQGGAEGPAGDHHLRNDHASELLPPVRHARRHDRYSGYRG